VLDRVAARLEKLFTPSAPWAWAVTLRPIEWAASTMASSSAWLNCWARPAAGVGQHAARGGDLDHVRARLHLLAHGAAAVVRT
jgi:hypothetical protein